MRSGSWQLLSSDTAPVKCCVRQAYRGYFPAYLTRGGTALQFINRSSLVIMALVLAMVVGGTSVALARLPGSRFSAAVTEEFCGPGVTCGSAVTSLGPAAVTTVITAFYPLPSGCFGDGHVSTLAFSDGSTLVLTVVGELCPTVVGFQFAGTFTAAGGTGRFEGVSGDGIVRASRARGPIHAVFEGTITLSP